MGETKKMEVKRKVLAQDEGFNGIVLESSLDLQ